ncbi:MAG: serine hydrolase [Acidimicrobiia bacterium]
MSVQEQVQAIVDDALGTFGIYARNLGTSETVDVNADRVMNTESAAKVFILLYYRQLVASGACNPAQRVALTDDDRYWGTGVLRYLGAGIQPTLDDLAWLMIIVSDNVATAMLLQQIGDQNTVNAAMKELGLESAQLNPSITVENAMAGEAFATATPRDLAEAFTFLDEPAKAILFRQQNQISLPRRLPHAADASDVDIEMPLRVYNKPGNGMGTCTDSGLFETPNASWIVAAMAADQTDLASRPDDAAPLAFSRIGELLFDAWGRSP